MRIALLTLEALAAAAPVRRFVAANPQRIALVALSDPFRPQRGGTVGQAVHLLRRSGPRFLPYLAADFVLPRLAGLLARGSPDPDRTPLAALCARLGVPAGTVADMNAPDFHDRLRASGAKAIVTFHRDQILTAGTIAALPRGGINVHAGLLPDHHGPVPTVHALLEATPRFGITVHRLVPRIDAGAVLAQCALDLPPSTTALAAALHLHAAAVPLLAEVLDRMAAALADGDDIRAVIRATGVNSDGRTNGFAVPSGEAQAALLRSVCDGAGIDPDDLCYFEAHGTGTPVGDPIEAHAIGTALGQRRQAALPIGSVKSNIGHLEPASGMAGLMKLILAFERGVVPASLHFAQPNPNIPFAALNLEVVTAPRALLPGRAGVLAGINAFGFGGTNAHALLAAPPPRAVPAGAEAALATPLLVSARCAGALRALAGSWQDRLAQAASAPAGPGRLPALLRGAARRRDQHAHRLALVAAPPAEMAARLDGGLQSGRQTGLAAGQAVAGDLAFVFSGNGSQWAGMAGDALARSPDFRAALAEVDARLAPELGWSVADHLCREDLATELRNTAMAQPLLFAVQVASVAALRAQGVRAVAHVGHSAGEVAAAWASGALSLDAACHVIIQRSLAQQATHGDGGMAALGLDAAAAGDLFVRTGLDLAIAAVNGAAAVTVAGQVAAIDRLGAIARSRGLAFIRLDLDYAFHSPAMEPIRAPLLAALAGGGLASAAPAALLVSTVTGAPVMAGELDAGYWWRNVRLPVLFQPAVDTLIGRGVRLFLEIGPAPVLQSFLREGLHRASQPGQVLASLTRRPQRADTPPLDPFAAIAAACHVAGAGIADAPALDGFATARGPPVYPWQRQRFQAVPRASSSWPAARGSRPSRWCSTPPAASCRDWASPRCWLRNRPARGRRSGRLRCMPPRRRCG